MRLLALSEGDAETWDSFSGIPKSIVDQLRAQGHHVVCGDVEPHGWMRLALAALTFSTVRRRWWTRYHLLAAPFRARSRAAQHLLATHREEIDAILQFGATFRVPPQPGLPTFLYCDGNIRLARRAAETGETDAAFLTSRELDTVAARESRVYHDATLIMTISRRLRGYFIEDFDLSPDKVHPVFAGPNFDTTWISPNARPSSSGLTPTILFVGRQFRRKGGDLLLRAFEQVRSEIADARLTIAGPASLDVDMPGVHCLGLLDKDTANGRAELVKAYSEARVYCMPTRFEGLSIAFLEAMFFGLPCVGTESPWTPPEMIVDGATGFVVPHEDADALARKLILLLKTPTLATKMGRAGRERAQEVFAWPRVVARMTSLMSETMGSEETG